MKISWSALLLAGFCALNKRHMNIKDVYDDGELRSLNPAHKERTLSVDDVLWIARIMWASQ